MILPSKSPCWLFAHPLSDLAFTHFHTRPSSDIKNTCWPGSVDVQVMNSPTGALAAPALSPALQAELVKAVLRPAMLFTTACATKVERCSGWSFHHPFPLEVAWVGTDQLPPRNVSLLPRTMVGYRRCPVPPLGHPSTRHRRAVPPKRRSNRSIHLTLRQSHGAVHVPAREEMGLATRWGWRDAIST